MSKAKMRRCDAGGRCGEEVVGVGTVLVANFPEEIKNRGRVQTKVVG